MAIKKTTWLLTLKHPEGHALFSLLLEGEELPEPEPPTGSAPPASPARPPRPEEPSTLPQPSGGDSDPRMTEPQRRYLFRLLALQGVEGPAAEEHLKQYFKVKSLTAIPKAAASQLIDQMVKDSKEAGHGAA